LSCTKNSPTGPSSPSADDMHWTKSQSPIYIKDCFVVPQGDTLIIDPGVEIIFKSSDWHYDFYTTSLKVGMLHIKGKLLAVGSEDEPITLTREDDKGEYFWGGIFIDSTLTEQNRIEYCNIKYSFRTFKDEMKGGISFYYSAGCVSHCNFLNNSSNEISCLKNSNVEIIYCEMNSCIVWGEKNCILCDDNSISYISNNNLSGPKGGIKCTNSSYAIIEENHVRSCDFGVYCNNYDSGHIVVQNNYIELCDKGISCHADDDSNIINNIIVNNSPYGVYSSTSSPKIINNLIVDNLKGITSDMSDSTFILNNTIVSNTLGIEVLGGIPQIINSIIWDNENAFYFDYILYKGSISFSLIQGESLPSQIHDEGNNIMNQNPLFVDDTNGYYELLDDSPCINAGNDEVENLPEFDLLGNPRISGISIDMGAYEYQE